MTTYDHAPEVAKIVKALIREVDDHKPLADVEIVCCWRDKATKSRGRVVLAKARKISGLQAFLHDPSGEDFFVIEVARDTWQRLDDAQRKALVDHEMCHLHVEPGETPVLSMRTHDLEEFAAIVERHGLWLSDRARFGEAVVEQLALAVDEVVQAVEDMGQKPPDPDEE